MNGPWSVRVLSAICVPWKPCNILCSYMFIICKCLIFMSENSRLANVCIALYPTLNKFLLTYLLSRLLNISISKWNFNQIFTIKNSMVNIVKIPSQCNVDNQTEPTRKSSIGISQRLWENKHLKTGPLLKSLKCREMTPWWPWLIPHIK